ncbi:hypothetical protein I4U23_022304 [Adineta vaga]|nr:hypothetical protein I4U23_022304 [Adineta vaga]
MSNLTNQNNEILPDLSRALIILPIMDKYMLLVIYTSGVLVSTSTKSAQCQTPSYAAMFVLIFHGYFFALFNGAIVPLFLSIFGFLIYRNVRLSRRRRISPTMNINNNPNINRQNLHLIIMLLVQASLTVILNIPYMTVYLRGLYYGVPTEQYLLLLYAISVYLARWFWFLNYAKTFYLNSLSSQIFRNALKQQLLGFIHQSRVSTLT